MPLPEVTVQFGGAAGQHEGLGPLDAAQFFSSEDSQNVYVEKAGTFGQIRKILGYAKQNSSAITTDTGSSAVKVVGLFPYRSMSGGTTTRHLLAVVDDATNEYEVWKSTDSGATWAFLAELGTTVGMIPDYAQMENNGYLVDAKGVSKVYDGSTLATAGGTQSPTITAAASATSGFLTGGYHWKLLSVKVNGDRQLASVASTEIRIENKKADLTWTADADTDVKGYELYRHTASGTEYYLVTYIEGRTTAAYTDNLSDPNLMQQRPLDEYGDAPATGLHFIEPFQQRMWYARTDANPRRMYYSDGLDADSVYANHFIEFTDAVSASDQITGMTGGFKDTMVVWQEYSVWAVSGTAEVINNVVNWNRWRTSARVGTVSHRSVIEVPAGAKYPDSDGRMVTTGDITLAFFTPYKTINLLMAAGADFVDTVISYPKEKFLDNVGASDTVQFQYRHLIWAEHDKVRGHIRWYFPHGTSQTVNNKGVQWDYRNGVWSEISTAPFACGCAIEEANVAQTLLCGEARTGTGGHVYKNWSGNSYDGSGNNVQADFWTKPFFGVDDDGRPLLEEEKRWKRSSLVTEDVSSAQNLTVTWYENMATAAASARGSTTVDMNVGAFTHGQVRIDLLDSNGDHMRSESMRLRLGDNADDAAWAVPVFTITYQVMPGLAPR